MSFALWRHPIESFALVASNHCAIAAPDNIGGPTLRIRNLSDCPLESQTAEVLEGKAQLYLWLQSKYAEQVEMDIDLGIPGWDHPADVVVRRNGQATLAYWIFDRGPRNRSPLLQPLPAGIQRQVIFTESAHSIHEANPTHLVLSAALRDFLTSGRYDEPYGGLDHLQFLDTQTGQLANHRGLSCVHKPSVYASKAVTEAPLASALISPKTGEIVLPQDQDALTAWKQKWGPKATDRPAYSPTEWTTSSPPKLAPPTIVDAAAPAGLDLNAPMRCERCGIMTKDWIRSKPSDGTCLCRSCV